MKTTDRLLGMFEIHDLVEEALIKSGKLEGLEVSPLWRFHDSLEREIIKLESGLPEDIRRKIRDME